MAKPTPTFECTACGARYPRAMGKCGACGAFATIEEVKGSLRVLDQSDRSGRPEARA